SNLRHVDLGHGSADPMDLRHTRLEGAQFQGANLRDAQLQGAKLRDAQLQGANLGGADLTSTNWTAAQATASLVKFVDLRGATGLTQGRLSSLIGNAATLLPEVLDDGSKPVLYDRWETEPEGFEALVENLKRLGENEAETRKAYLCEDGQKPRQVGIPLALDADPPWGPHPPNSDEAREWVKQQESARS
ncbi:MAG: pentapeptide repeat-containing protein, partial [Pseudomonadota bacterium]